MIYKLESLCNIKKLELLLDRLFKEVKQKNLTLDDAFVSVELANISANLENSHQIGVDTTA